MRPHESSGTGVGRRTRLAIRGPLRRLGTATPLLSLLLAGACAASPEGAAGGEPAAPFADCAALAAPPAAASPPGTDGAPAASAPGANGTGGRPSPGLPAAMTAGSPTPAAGSGTPTAGSPTPLAGSGTPTAGSPTPLAGSGTPTLPDIHLPCFTGGATVPLAALRGPAVINVWASWCQPCRKELPALQRLADRAGGRVHVIGVDTRDRRDSARSLAADLGLTFPNLVDGDELLRTGLGRAALPITVFLDRQGRIRHLDESGALDDAALASLVQRHLGVATAP